MEQARAAGHPGAPAASSHRPPAAVTAGTSSHHAPAATSSAQQLGRSLKELTDELRFHLGGKMAPNTPVVVVVCEAERFLFGATQEGGLRQRAERLLDVV